MTIDEAIEILTQFEEWGSLYTWEQVKKASQLGIEALKAVGFVRTSYPGALTYLLPGETKD